MKTMENRKTRLEKRIGRSGLEPSLMTMSDDWSWNEWNAWTDDWGNWSWTDSSWTASGTPSTQESMVPTAGTGPRPTVQNQTAQSSGRASSAQYIVFSIPLDGPSTVQITDLESVAREDTDKSTVPYFDSLSKIHDDCVFFPNSVS